MWKTSDSIYIVCQLSNIIHPRAIYVHIHRIVHNTCTHISEGQELSGFSYASQSIRTFFDLRRGGWWGWKGRIFHYDSAFINGGRGVRIGWNARPWSSSLRINTFQGSLQLYFVLRIIRMGLLDHTRSYSHIKKYLHPRQILHDFRRANVTHILYICTYEIRTYVHVCIIFTGLMLKCKYIFNFIYFLQVLLSTCRWVMILSSWFFNCFIKFAINYFHIFI